MSDLLYNLLFNVQSFAKILAQTVPLFASYMNVFKNDILHWLDQVAQQKGKFDI